MTPNFLCDNYAERGGGALKVKCRNAINSTIYNSDSMPPGTAATTAGSANDWWDTIDDYKNNANELPTTLVSGWTSDTHCDATNWQDMTNNGAGDTTCDTAGDQCMFKDRISGLLWSEAQASSNWSAAVALCDGLNASNFGGYNSGWRLPTQKELMEAYIHGIRDVGYKAGTTGTTSNNNNFIANVDSYFPSSTSYSEETGNAWGVFLGHGSASYNPKSNLDSVLCVR